MSEPSISRSSALPFLLLFVLPLAGAWLDGQDIRHYAEFPPLTRYVVHAGFSWPLFALFTAFVLVIAGPVAVHAARAWRRRPAAPPCARAFPWWGWGGVALTAAAWVLAWTRFPWFESFQTFTFSPLWFGYILVVNGLACRRTGHCMMTDRPRYFLSLFLLSAAFWWFFEYLNRFVQNWYYVGVSGLTPLQYFVYATLPFSTVLPAVLGTYDLLAGVFGPADTAARFRWFPVNGSRALPWAVFAAACAGLAGIGIWPDILFPLLWISPLLVLASWQAIRSGDSLVFNVGTERWHRICLLALAALICGFFWEMWNFHSLAKWIYAVPFVNRFHLFEMPLLGYAGYLPFGLECALIGGLVEPPTAPTPRTRRPRRTFRALLALAIAAAVWLPCLQIIFRPNLRDYFAADGIPPKTRAMAAHQMELWSNAVSRTEEVRKMRGTNAEWDFMGRTFLVLSLANMSLRDPARKPEYVALMDRIIEDTIRLEEDQGVYYFLMDYAREQAFVAKPARSLFQDGEIGLMLAARRAVEEKEEYAPMLAQRVKTLVAQMRQSPVLCGESYPNECWIFCNTVALATIRMADILDRTDHAEFIRRWLDTAKSNLTDPATGLLISSFSFGGQPYDGPEGSSIWMSAHCLQLIDPVYAEELYRRAKRELAGSVLGFGYAREWPETWKGEMDVDSGPVVPGLEVSAGSSGLAVLGAATFGDEAYLAQLIASLEFGGFPVQRNGRLRFSASNQVGDAVLLYALVQGPLWKEMGRRTEAFR